MRAICANVFLHAVGPRKGLLLPLTEYVLVPRDSPVRRFAMFLLGQCEPMHSIYAYTMGPRVRLFILLT